MVFSLHSADGDKKGSTTTTKVKHVRGLWTEGGDLDRADKRWSMPIFTSEVPFFVEALLTIVGTWFGIPMIALTLVPLGVASTRDYFSLRSSPKQEDQEQVFKTLYAFLGVLATLLVMWVYRGIKSRSGEYGFAWAYKPGESRVNMIYAFIFSPHVALLISSNFASREGHAAACFTVIAWMASTALNEVCKSIFKRRRPVVVDTDMAENRELSPARDAIFRQKLLKAHRHFPELQRMLRDPHSAHNSFPSGDATGAASAATAFLLAGIAPSLLGTSSFPVVTPAGVLNLVSSLPSVLLALAFASACTAAFGRVFFHAHHVLDVTIGLIGGTCTTATLAHFTGTGADVWSWKILVFLQLAMVIAVIPTGLLKRTQVGSIDK